MLGRYITGEKNGYFNKTLGQEKYKHLPIAFQEYYLSPRWRWTRFGHTINVNDRYCGRIIVVVCNLYINNIYDYVYHDSDIILCLYQQFIMWLLRMCIKVSSIFTTLQDSILETLKNTCVSSELTKEAFPEVL